MLRTANVAEQSPTAGAHRSPRDSLWTPTSPLPALGLRAQTQVCGKVRSYKSGTDAFRASLRPPCFAAGISVESARPGGFTTALAFFLFQEAASQPLKGFVPL